MSRSTTRRTTGRTTGAVVSVGLVGGLLAGATWLVPSAGADEPTPTAAAPASARPGYTLSTSAGQVVVGDTVTLTVGASAAEDLYAYDLAVTFDPKVLAYVEDSATTDITGATYDAAGVGEVHVVHTKLGSSPAASGALTLATLSFTALHTGAVDLVADELVTTATSTQETTTDDLGTTPVAVVARAAATATSTPTVSGTPQVGLPLTVSPGTWDVPGLAYAYQWLRGGAPIPGATAASYTPVPGDVDQALSAVVSAAAPDRVTATAATSPVTVRTAPTTIGLDVGKARKGRKVTVLVTVRATGAVPTGGVKVYYDDRGVGGVRTLSGGVVELKLPAVRKGKHRLTVSYRPGRGFDGSVVTTKVRVR